MRWFFAFLSSIVAAVWRHRVLSSTIVALYTILFLPAILAVNWPDFPIRYDVSGDPTGAIQSIILFEQVLPLPVFATPLIGLLTVVGVVLNMLALVRTVLRGHWIWFLVVLLWPLAILYYLFGPAEQERPSQL